MKEENEWTQEIKGVLGSYWFKESDDPETARKVIAMAETKYPQRRTSIVLQRCAYIEGMMEWIRANRPKGERKFWVTATIGCKVKGETFSIGPTVTEDSLVVNSDGKGFDPVNFVRLWNAEGMTCSIVNVIEVTGIDTGDARQDYEDTAAFRKKFFSDEV